MTGYSRRTVEPQSRPLGGVSAPPVVVVVVTHDTPGDRFNALMASLAAQDYPNHRVLVVDAASRVDPTPLVRRALPDARVVRLPVDAGFGASANQVLDVGDDAAYYVFCHDDVVPEPHAISALVEVASTWQADVVGPKLVSWDDPSRLQQMGLAVDKIGTSLPFVEPGELDQAQHDGLRDVFSVPGAFTLVSAELFEDVGGFDEAVSFVGDDLSLCWRARVAGARVLVASSARVRHAQALTERLDGRTRRRLADRHRLRAMLMCTGARRLAAVVPQALLVSLATAVVALATGRFAAAGDALGAWLWNLRWRRLRSLLVARGHVRTFRQVPDRVVRQSQVRGLVGPRLRIRRLGGDARRAAAGAEPGDEDPSSWSSATALVWVALVGVLVFGSRHLITRFVPATGELVPFDTAPGTLLAEWAGGWREVGLGAPAAAPALLGVLGAVGAVVGDHMGVVRTLLTLGLLPVGIVGAHRLLRPTGSRWAQVAAAVAYAALPVPYNALAGGRWSALAAYAGAPWMLGCLARASGMAPFVPGAGPAVASLPAHPLRRHVVAAGTLTGVVALLVPTAPAALAVAAVALAVGSALALEARGAGRLLVTGFGGAAVAALLHLPVTLGAVRSAAAIEAWLGLERPAGELSALDLLRFDTGPFGAAPLGFALAVAALVPLLVGRAWRLAWAVRAWTVAVAFWGLVWIQQEGSAGLPLPHPDVLLAPAGAALALAVALGVAALDADVRGRTRRLGASRLVTALGGLALVAAVVPVAGASLDGWWKAPPGDFGGLLAPMTRATEQVPSRVLWVGDPDVLPGGPGFGWRPGVSYATSLEGPRGLSDLWPGPEEGATGRLRQALDLAVERRTTRLGRVLAPMGVAYVAVPLRSAPSPFADEEHPVPDEVLRALGSQLDLVEVPADPAIVVYRNTAVAPVRALVPEDGATEPTGVGAASEVDLSGALPVLLERDGVGYRGTLPPGFTLVQGSAASGRWRLEVEGEVMRRREAWGWANAWPTAGGSASLIYETPPLYRAALVVQAALWLAALFTLLRMRYAGEGPAPGGLRAGAGGAAPEAETAATGGGSPGGDSGPPGPPVRPPGGGEVAPPGRRESVPAFGHPRPEPARHDLEPVGPGPLPDPGDGGDRP